ncbi:MAG TPA: adenylate/guanylate cyclase domain-containing protein [Candidatus Limnocylindrales bacterium]|jgi:adenylate cyclase
MSDRATDTTDIAHEHEHEPSEEPTSFVSDPMWEKILNDPDSGFALGRNWLRMIPSAPRCKLCAAPFKGPGAPFMRMLDRGPWEKNPTICGLCFKQIEKARGGAEIELSMLFTDVRGSTGLAETMGPLAFQKLLDRFYREATNVLVDRDAVVDKFVGDEVVALFLPVLNGTDHARDAVDAARELLRATGHGSDTGPWIPLGAGVHTGVAYVGSIGDTVTDFTALGDSVNVTARLASAASVGEILVSSAAADAAGLDATLEARTLSLRGRAEPLDVRVLHV